MSGLIDRQAVIDTNSVKPCPFCGSKGILNHKKELESWIVECSNNTCPASYMIGWDYETAEEAIRAWNKRIERRKDNEYVW